MVKRFQGLDVVFVAGRAFILRDRTKDGLNQILVPARRILLSRTVDKLEGRYD